MIKLVDQSWNEEFTDAFSADGSRLRIICPFIKAEALKDLLPRRPGKIQVITRFSLADFAGGVSDVDALRMLLDIGARVRGVRNLRTKLYPVGKSRAIITSANLTTAALNRNHELGIVTGDAAVIRECRAYFRKLWRRAGSDLRLKTLERWSARIQQYQLQGGRPDDAVNLSDFGTDVGIRILALVNVPMIVADASRAFVKFQGNSDNRVSLSALTMDEVESSGCHWAVCYSGQKGRPRQIKNGDIVFMERLTKSPNDIRTFGRAKGITHKEGRDDATLEDIKLRPWRSRYARYIRVHTAKFVGGTLANGVSLNELMNTLEENSFKSTQRHAQSGNGNVDPRKAYLQQGSVELSAEGLMWLAERLQNAFEAHGTISQKDLDRLDWPSQADLSNGV